MILQGFEFDKYKESFLKNAIFKGNALKKYYLNTPLFFKISFNSFKNEKKELISVMYAWHLSYNDVIFEGRTYKELLYILLKFKKLFELNENKKIIVFCKNLAIEFQFLRKWIQWDQVFAVDNYKPFFAINVLFFEFRSILNLNPLINSIIKKDPLKTQLKGNKTNLTNEDRAAVIEEIEQMQKVIKLELKQYNNNINRLPLTTTGAARRYVRRVCLNTKNKVNKNIKNYNYLHKIDKLNIYTLKEYYTIKRAFYGGYINYNSNYTNKTLQNVASYDIVSSYPFIMLSERFPMSSSINKKVENLEELEEYCKKFCCVFDIEFNNIILKEGARGYIQANKCFYKKQFEELNGFLIYAKTIQTTLTNVDYLIIKQIYNYINIKINNIYIYKMDFLPIEITKSILKLYKDKTNLKDVKGSEQNYKIAKSLLNSVYGMTVTDPLKDKAIYTNEWKEQKKLNELNEKEAEEYLNKKVNELIDYNCNKSRFLYYLWGVFVTSYSRLNIFKIVNNLKNDFVYCDTDCVKFVNHDLHKNIINKYNETVFNKLKAISEFLKIDFEEFQPANKKGEKKLIGSFELENLANEFKFLNKKRYIYKIKNNYFIVCAGLDGQNIIKYLKTLKNSNTMEEFNENLTIPKEYAENLNVIYLNYNQSGFFVDYTGQKNYYCEKSSVYYEFKNYTLNNEKLFLTVFLNSLQM